MVAGFGVFNPRFHSLDANSGLKPQAPVWGPPDIANMMMQGIAGIGDSFMQGSNFAQQRNQRQFQNQQLLRQQGFDNLAASGVAEGLGGSMGQQLLGLGAQFQQQGGGGMPSFTQPQRQGMLPTFARQAGAGIAASSGVSEYADLFSNKESQYNLPSGYLAGTAFIESRGNPNAKNPRSSAGGLFQQVDSNWSQYGVPGATRFDPVASTEAAARFAADNRRVLMGALGREPTSGELYLAHQQGPGGAVKLLSNPNARAADVVGPKAVRLNGGDMSMSAGQFAGLWTSKLDGAGPNTVARVQAEQKQLPTPPSMQRGVQVASADPRAMTMPQEAQGGPTPQGVARQTVPLTPSTADAQQAQGVLQAQQEVQQQRQQTAKQIPSQTFLGNQLPPQQPPPQQVAQGGPEGVIPVPQAAQPQGIPYRPPVAPRAQIPKPLIGALANAIRGGNGQTINAVQSAIQMQLRQQGRNIQFVQTGDGGSALFDQDTGELSPVTQPQQQQKAPQILDIHGRDHMFVPGQGLVPLPGGVPKPPEVREGPNGLVQYNPQTGMWDPAPMSAGQQGQSADGDVLIPPSNVAARAALDIDPKDTRTYKVGRDSKGRRTIEAVPAPDVRESQEFTQTRTLHEDFESRKPVQDFRMMEQGLQGLEATFKEGNANSDLLAIIQMYKTVDPTSVVSMNETMTQTNAAGIPDQMRAAWNHMIGQGGKITPEVRARIFNAVQSVAVQRQRQVEQIAGGFRNRAKAFNLNPDQVVTWQPWKFERRAAKDFPDKEEQPQPPPSIPSPGGLQIQPLINNLPPGMPPPPVRFERDPATNQLRRVQ